MYKEIFEKYKNVFPDFPNMRRPRVGTVIKNIRTDKGILQKHFAKMTTLNLATLKNIENDHRQATTIENLSLCAKVLGLTTDELIILGRERDPCNYFAYKLQPTREIKGIRKRKRLPEEWHQTMRLRFKDFDITPISAPILSKRDFLALRVNLPPKRSIENLILGAHYPVIGFVAGGFNLKIKYAKNLLNLTSHQSFLLDGFFAHSIINDDEDQSAIIYLITKLPNYNQTDLAKAGKENVTPLINIAEGIEELQRRCSTRPGRNLPIRHLADQTDTLDHFQVGKLSKIRKESSLVDWEKIEDLLGCTGISMEEFLAWSHGQSHAPFSLATAKTRALIDYTVYQKVHGIKVYSAMPPNAGTQFFCGELFLEGQKETRSIDESLIKRSWNRKDNAMIALYVEAGEIEVTVGQHRSPLPLEAKSSIYFDGGLGYILRNPTNTQAKCFFASCPQICI